MKQLLLSAALIAGVVSSSYAEDRRAAGEKKTTQKDIKGQPGYFLNANVPAEAYCANKRPSNNGQFMVDAAVYYFQPKIGGETFAYTDNGSSLDSFVISGDTYSADLDWGWGFDVGIGYSACPCYDYWQTRIGYTRLSSSTTNRVQANAGAGEVVAPLFGNALIVDDFSTLAATEAFVLAGDAKLNSRFTYNAGELSLARSCFVTPRLALTPIAAVKAAWIDYDQTVRYTGGDPLALGGFFDGLSLLGIGDNTVTVSGENRFWGIGPAVAMDANWYFTKHLSLVSNLGASLLYGQFKVKHTESYSALPGNSVNLRTRVNQYLPNVNMDLGLSYDVDFSKGCRFEATLVYSNQYFWRYNQTLRVKNILDRYDVVSEDLALQSAKLEIAFMF